MPGIDQFTTPLCTALRLDLEFRSSKSLGSQELRPLRSTTESDKLDCLIINVNTGYL